MLPLQRVLAAVRRPDAALRWVARKLGRWLYYDGEYRLYLRPIDAAVLASAIEFQRDALDALQSREPAAGHDTVAFLREAGERRARGEHVYTFVEDGRLLHYAWLIDRQESSGSDFGVRTTLPPGCAVLYDDFTHPAARGRGLHTASLQRRLRDAATVPGARWVVIGVMADNAPSRRNIEKAGFRHFRSLYCRTRLGGTRTWERDVAPDGERHTPTA